MNAKSMNAEPMLYQDSPDVGPDCRCSGCNEAILEGPAIRVFEEKGGLLDPVYEYRFHPKCAVYYGMLTSFDTILEEE